jgi:hypothetical protein
MGAAMPCDNGQILHDEFEKAVDAGILLESTGADHLWHTKFVALRDDKDPRGAVREA